MKSEKGNILVISIIFITIAIIIFTFVIAVFMGHINSILYNVKLDMYSMNRTALIAVNKNTANVDYFSYDEDVYRDEFIKLLKTNYELDESLSNPEKLITSIDIEEYEIYEERQRDSYTKDRCDDRVIHTVLRVKIKPIILKEFLEDLFVFIVHEDVNINMMVTGK